MKLISFIAACVSTSATIALADGPIRHTVIFENDMMGPPKTDNNYTMGLGYIASGTGTKIGPDFMFGLLERLNAVTGVNSRGVESTSPTVFTVASTNFTPTKLTRSDPIRNDRPYASLLYVGTSYETTDEVGISTETEFEVGLLGSSIGRVVQTHIHEHCCRNKIPMGWDNQIGQGGSLTFLYHARKIVPFMTPWANHVRILGHYGADAGYYTRATAGSMFILGGSVGDLDAIRLAGSSTGLRALRRTFPDDSTSSPTKRGTGFTLWLNYEASLFAYNELLQGAWTGRNNVKYSYGDMKKVVHQANAGIDMGFLLQLVPIFDRTDVHLYYTQGWRSRDLKISDPGGHYWGGLTLSLLL